MNFSSINDPSIVPSEKQLCTKNDNEKNNDDNDLACETWTLDQEVQNCSIPERSANVYKTIYERFTSWMKKKDVKKINESTLLEYFNHLLEKKYKPTSLWSQYSMLKTTLMVYQRININPYKKLIDFLREQGKRHEPSVRKHVLTEEQAQKFLNEAPDEEYLPMKVVLIFGLMGTCKIDELVQLTIDDVQDDGEMLLVTIPGLPGRKSHSFSIVGEFYKLVKKYTDLRPKRSTTSRFFLRYDNGKCLNNPIGRNKFGTLARDIANYLNIPNANEFTGTSIRRTSAAFIARMRDAQVSLKIAEPSDGDDKTGSAREFVTQAINFKRNISQQLTEAIVGDQQAAKRQKIDDNRVIASTSGKNKILQSKSDIQDMDINTYTEIHLDDSMDSLELDNSFDPLDLEMLNSNECSSTSGDSEQRMKSECKLNTLENEIIDNKTVMEMERELSIKFEKSLVSAVDKVMEYMVKQFDNVYEKIEKRLSERVAESETIRLKELDLQNRGLVLKERELELKERELRLKERELTAMTFS